MIQRIQTVFLLIVVGLLVATMCLPMGSFVDIDGEHVFNALGVEIGGNFQLTWGLFGVLALSTVVIIATILLYKYRMLQIRMIVFTCLLLLGYYFAFVAFYFAFKMDTNVFRIGWAVCLPFIAIVFNILAIRTIFRDEVMMKAADRLR